MHLAQVLLRAFNQHQSNVALIEVDREKIGRTLTYSEVMQQALALAGALQQLGITAGNKVAICMQNQSRWLIAATAGFLVGAVIIPIDYKATLTEKITLLNLAQAELLFIDNAIANDLVMQNPAIFSITKVIQTSIAQDHPSIDEMIAKEIVFNTVMKFP